MFDEYVDTQELPEYKWQRRDKGPNEPTFETDENGEVRFENLLGGDAEENVDGEAKINDGSPPPTFSVMLLIKSIIEQQMFGKPGEQQKDPIMSLVLRLGLGLDLLYDALAEHNFPLILLNCAYVPIMTLFLFLRYVKNELVFLVVALLLYSLGCAAIAFLFTFLGQMFRGFGIY